VKVWLLSVHEALESSYQPNACKFYCHIVVPANSHLSIDPNNYAESGISTHSEPVAYDSPLIRNRVQHHHSQYMVTHREASASEKDKGTWGVGGGLKDEGREKEREEAGRKRGLLHVLPHSVADSIVHILR